MKFKGRKEFPNKSPVSEGQLLKVRITDVGKQGDGIARIEGLIIFVKGAKVGQELEVKVVKVSKTSAFAEPVVVQSSNCQNQDQRF
ncbi:MAG: TRAM domain-containing protein [Methanomassiliicoccales archaeon]|nr:MAG: TRAM domain-containing protein [Methanomassiliicoccales archaeon]